ncbi:hypothetical protein ABW19_dt0209947 [Dactylella cylindrospora]|nr:hypothetical protein ABW19_dt0209947 [Dactylella cylindrospora]
MSNSVLKRPALGQVAALGSLYDSRSDSFISLSLFKSVPPPGSVNATQKRSADIKSSSSANYRDKFNSLNIHADLGASFLGNFVPIAGSACILYETCETNTIAQASIYYNINTIDEDLDLTSQGVKDSLAFNTIQAGQATHVVTGISWGANCVVTARQDLTPSQNKSKLAAELDEKLKTKVFGLQDTDGEEPDTTNANDDTEDGIDVNVYCDLPADEGTFLTDFKDARKFISDIPGYISKANGGKGVPLVYTLMPLTLLAMFRVIELKADITLHQVSSECLEQFHQLFDEIHEARRNLTSYLIRLRTHKGCCPARHIKDVEDKLGESLTIEADLKSEYGRLLNDARSGKADAKELWSLLGELRDPKSEKSPQHLSYLIAFDQKMQFMDLVKSGEAGYIGYNNAAVYFSLPVSKFDDAFVFYFNEETREKSPAWDACYDLLLELLREKDRKYLVLVVDCEAIGKEIDDPYISQFRNQKCIVPDVVEQRKVLAANCIVRYNPAALNNASKEKPLQRRTVKIPCPCPSCDRTLQCTWVCSCCEGVIEYGQVDDNLYCDCGSCGCDQWEFKCKDPRHGSTWAHYDKAELRQLLRSLEPFSELNILILGETGVGKSTWINAFVNYLTHETLDDAFDSCADGDLKWVIPCSFTTQTKDKSDPKGRFVQKEVRIGSSGSEKDGSKGQSATQMTNVYAVDINQTRVRLIDTPGIGDTRGLDQDNENMVDILRVLRAYSKLHGILILLKPNAARLTVMFRFCVKQLLTHLHRNAANNIVFGFTNTRGSNYKPGDTFKPLETLLSEYKELQMGLFEHNVYCFDSESFRYLAARKKGIEMGYVEENRRSWQHSVKESHRLVKHFQSLKPHEVRSTINLNETRTMILRMTEPMTLLSQKIQATIDINEDEINELRDRRLTREQLLKKLYVPIESLASVEVDQPRTVCTNETCIEVRSDFEGRSEMAIIYKTFCHSPCYLRGVRARAKGDSILQGCACVGPEGKCTGCHHPWEDHMHIYNEYVPKTYETRDRAVERDLGDNASKIQVQQEAIAMRENKITEFKLEYAQVQEAAIQFGFFLKRHAITPYNDATIEYLDVLIDQEKIKIAAGGDKKKLIKYQDYRRQHQEKVKILTEAMARGDNRKVLDDQGVHQTIKGLYGLPNFGADLKDMVMVNEKAAERCYRERTYNVSAGSHWKNQRNQRRGGKAGGSHKPTKPKTQTDDAPQPISPPAPSQPARSWGFHSLFSWVRGGETSPSENHSEQDHQEKQPAGGRRGWRIW